MHDLTENASEQFQSVETQVAFDFYRYLISTAVAHFPSKQNLSLFSSFFRLIHHRNLFPVIEGGSTLGIRNSHGPRKKKKQTDDRLNK